jgi:hypothetical protein
MKKKKHLIGVGEGGLMFFKFVNQTLEMWKECIWLKGVGDGLLIFSCLWTQHKKIKIKNVWCREEMFNFNSREYYHFESCICLNYEKKKKVEHETMGITTPILLKVLLFT